MSFSDTLARVVRAVDPGAEGIYECKDCDARFDLDRQTCPECGGCSIDRSDWGSLVSE